jgi:hypothetical protein
MPLRDHFRPPLTKRTSWEVLHGQWPAVIVQQLRKTLPPGYVAGPTVQHGAFEVDVAAFETEEAREAFAHGGGNVATMTAAWIAEPAVQVETDLADFDEYDVRIYALDDTDRRLVAAIEIVSPANKDRAERRNAFIAKCAGLLQSGVAVSIVDVVTTRQFNLYAELMSFLGHPDENSNATAPIYATSCRYVRRGRKTYLQTWPSTLSLGQPLPKIPLWLAEALVVPLDLEESYEQACRDLWIA